MLEIPKTLRQINNLPDKPAKLTDSVLIIVDAQKEYTQGSLPLTGIKESIAALSNFLQRVRGVNVPVIHVIQVGKEGGPICNPKGPFIDIIDEVKPQEGEYIVEKKLPSSFKGTALQSILEKIGKKDLIISGYMTHMCVNSTVRDAAELGYNCTVVEELTATRDLPDGRGGIIPAKFVKDIHLIGLSDRFAIICKSADELE